MSKSFGTARRYAAAAVCAGALASAWTVGCNSFGFDTSYFLNNLPPFIAAGATVTDTSQVGGNATGDSGVLTGGTTSSTDPCQESVSNKFIHISMRNLSEDFVHYFLVLVAFENGNMYPDGAVCPADADLYTSFGYQRINAGASSRLGDYCITGPAFVYFHLAGRFRNGGTVGSNTLGSAIGPAQGTNATFDSFFTSAGKQVPVPNVLLFHNPGTGDGARLSTRSLPNRCAMNVIIPLFDQCSLDSWYYVDQDDRIAGSNAVGAGSGRRVPTEIQGTACECGAVVNGFQAGAVLAAPGTSSTDVSSRPDFCNQFIRGGRIEYVFLRNDETPSFPQLVWRVTDGSGGQIHNFDNRSGVK